MYIKNKMEVTYISYKIISIQSLNMSKIIKKKTLFDNEIKIHKRMFQVLRQNNLVVMQPR